LKSINHTPSSNFCVYDYEAEFHGDKNPGGLYLTA
jgi:hypothetical protein